MSIKYEAKAYRTLIKNLMALDGKLTVDSENHITRSLVNTCLFAEALHETFNTMFNEERNIVGMLLMTSACDYSPLEQ